MTAPMSARDGSAFSGYKVNQNILQHDTIMEHQYMNEGMCGFFRIFAHATNREFDSCHRKFKGKVFGLQACVCQIYFVSL